MDERRRDFLAGERPTEVLLYLSDEAVTDPERLAGEGDGERVEDGTVVVVDGERGRRAFAAATGVDAMNFAGRARGRTGEMNRALTGGTCPDDTAERETADADHRVRFLFAFAEAQQPEGEGLYAEGDVVHAYAQCSCGVAYSDRWVAVDGAD